MPVSVSYAPLSYSGNGVTTSFAVTWPFYSATLRVTKIASTGVETVQTISTHYTVTGGTDTDGLPATGSVTMLTAPASGEQIRIERVTPLTQTIDLTAGGDFNPKVVTSGLDKLTLISQEGGGGGFDGITGDVLQLDSSGAQDFWDGEGKPVRMSFLEVSEMSAPDTPASGYGRIYTKSDGALYHKNDAGTETSLTDGATAAATSAAAAATSASNAATSATNAATSATNAATSATAAAALASASSFKWALDTSTSMADPGSGEIRFNNASWASVTAIAIADNSADSGNPDVSAVVLTWDDSTNSTHRGNLTFRKLDAPEEFVTFSITGGSTDNTGWTQLAVTHVGGNPSWSAADELVAVFTRTGNAGANGAGSGDMLAANNLSDVADAATSRSNLGLNALATLATVGTSQIDNGAVTYAKLQDVSATSRVLGRKTSGAGDAEECTLSELLDFIGSAAQGDILYRGASAWARLAAGTSGHYLQTQGAAANPQWAAVGGGFAAGTKLLFQQTAAPTGWTKDTTHNDKALRVVSGTASSGGTNSFTTAMVNSFNSGATTLTTSQIPSHTHGGVVRSSGGDGYETGAIYSRSSGSTDSAGTGGSHTHTVQLNVQYVDVIIATKD